jgi:hypothetical protein
MKCPNCNVEMTKGVAEVHGTALDFLAFGMSHQHLWFKIPHKRNIKIIESGGFRSAWHCENCNGTLISQSDEKELSFQQIVEITEGST